MRVIWRQADNESRMWAIFQSEIENCMTGTIFYLRVLLTSTVFTLLETFLQYWTPWGFNKTSTLFFFDNARNATVSL